jgi:hypothetical protein
MWLVDPPPAPTRRMRQRAAQRQNFSKGVKSAEERGGCHPMCGGRGTKSARPRLTPLPLLNDVHRSALRSQFESPNT